MEGAKREMRENKKKKQRKVDVQSYINNVLKVEEENDGLRFKIKGLESENQEQAEEIERLKNQEKLRIDAENDKIKLGELLVVWNRIGRAITQSCEGHEEHDVENLLAQIKDVSTEELFETKLKIEIERDRYCRLYVNA